MMTTAVIFFANHAGTLEYVVRLALFALLVGVVFGRFAPYHYLRRMTFRSWVVLTGAWMVVYATVLTIGQYVLWGNADMTRELLQTPLSSDTPRLFIHAPILPFTEGAHGYYIFYAYTHFWMPVLLALGSAVLVYGLFTYLRTRKPIAVAREEVMLASGIAFLAGWPNVLIFVTLAFLGAVVHAIVGHVRHGVDARTRMVHSIIIAGLITLAVGVYVGAKVGIGAMVI